MCKKENHNLNRDRVCIGCLLKADLGRASDYELKTFRERWLQNYDENNPFSPTGICTGCQIRLHASYDKTKGKIPQMYLSDYAQILPGII